MNREATRDGRRDERGAALVTALLVSLLMLAAGGALVYTTGMSAVNAIDATAEAQAYYAAEAGLQSAVSVLRGNVAKQGEMDLPNGTKIKNNLRVANQLATSNMDSDEVNWARLSGWLPYNGTGEWARVELDANGQTAFALKLEDPNDTDRAKLAASANYMPQSIVITSTGYGPKGAVKQMQLLYRRSAFEFDPKATLLMAGNVSHFAIGSSKKKGYSGADEADPSAAPLPTFGFTVPGSETTVNNDIFNCGSNQCKKASDSTNNPRTDTISSSDLPSWLKTPQEADAFLDDLQAQAMDTGRYYATKSGASVPDIGTAADPDTGLGGNPKFTFIDGNYSAGGSGAGLLVVTGELTFKGNFTFDGIVLVLGSYKDEKSGELLGGKLQRNGGGNGTIAGAVIVAKFDREDPDAFLNTYFDTNGGGNSDMVYDSEKVADALGTLGGRLLGVVEN